MASNWAHAFAYCLVNEGSVFVQDPTPTLRGITLQTLTAWRGAPCTADDIRTLSLSETQQIYAARYWQPIAGDRLSSEPVATSLFDVAVNCGVAHAAKSAQAIAGVTADGVIGPVSLRAINSISQDAFVLALIAIQHAYYLGVVRSKPALLRYGATWQQRCAKYALLLC